jgi:hypothetical protein
VTGLLRVGVNAKVAALNRPTKEDRSAYEGKSGLVMRRLNVPWDTDSGALWELRFEDGKTIVFSDSELSVVRNGKETPVDMDELKETWGDAPRTASLPFRRFGAGVGAAPAVLALLVFAIAGVLLLWAGFADGNVLLGAAGAVLVLIGIGAAGVLIS